MCCAIEYLLQGNKETTIFEFSASSLERIAESIFCKKPLHDGASSVTSCPKVVRMT